MSQTLHGSFAKDNGAQQAPRNFAGQPASPQPGAGATSPDPRSVPTYRLLEAALIARAVTDPLATVGIRGCPMSAECAYVLKTVETWPIRSPALLAPIVGVMLNLDHALGSIREEFGERCLVLCELAGAPALEMAA